MKANLFRFYIAYFLLNTINNLIHPVTPAYIKLMNMPNYMFGLLFSSMALGHLMLSPFWGNISDRIGRIPIIRICIGGYAIGQLGFATFSIPQIILLCRFLSGLFSGGFQVIALAYIADITYKENKAKALSFYAAISTIARSFGFFIGGMVGTLNIYYAFILQIILLSCETIFLGKYLPESLTDQNKSKEKINFFQSLKIFDLKKGKKILTFPLIIFFIGVMLSEFSRVGFNNSFNFHLKAGLNLPPSYNGTTMGIIGILSLIINLTINPYIIKKFNLRKTLPLILVTNGIIGLLLIIFNNSLNLFFSISILFYMLNALYIPIQQSLYTEGYNKNYGLLSGYFNASKSIGMILGGLISGFAYNYFTMLPFALVSFSFLIAGILYTINCKQFSININK
ncbi:MAG: MFS transporter [Fusobacterium sp. JB021]|nr:MFS transporter [Fusobacterium sp. JB021]MDP0506301.1 MFS transporter [Fusobacterium sp. JB019]